LLTYTMHFDAKYTTTRDGTYRSEINRYVPSLVAILDDLMSDIQTHKHTDTQTGLTALPTSRRRGESE